MTANPTALRELAGAYRLSQAIAAAAGIGVGDALAAGPRDSDEVARQLGAHAPTLRRLLRALAGEGVLSEDGDGRFSLTSLGQCLRSDDPDSTREMVLGWTCLREGYEAFAQLQESVMTGRSGFELTFGQTFHDYLTSHPDRAAVYGAAMDSTVDGFEGAIDAHDFSPMKTIVDVGGGGGAFLTCLLRRHPDLHGVLFEVPNVINHTQLPEDVADRIECVSGDARREVPAGGDGYVLCTVLRCFDDDRVVEILTACRRAMKPGARLLACEMVLPPGPLEPMAGLADLQALMLYGGGDRDTAQWEELMSRAGLSMQGIQEADPPFSWLIAIRAE